MAVRTTAGAVQKILGRDWDGETVLDPYIETASAVVDRVTACATAKSITLSSSLLELIERWMAAHYYTVMDPIYKSKNTEGAGASFNDRSYKEVAVELDYTGCLNAILSKQRASVAWLGKPKSAQIDYVDRD